MRKVPVNLVLLPCSNLIEQQGQLGLLPYYLAARDRRESRSDMRFSTSPSTQAPTLLSDALPLTQRSRSTRGEFLPVGMICHLVPTPTSVRASDNQR